MGCQHANRSLFQLVVNALKNNDEKEIKRLMDILEEDKEEFKKFKTDFKKSSGEDKNIIGEYMISETAVRTWTWGKFL
jgi:DNA-directed RNA polymerase alpha subunit